MKMSVETAKAFGVALGMWAKENGACFTREGIGDCCDCVAVEETEVWAALSRFLDERNQYPTGQGEVMFKQMYETAKGGD